MKKLALICFGFAAACSGENAAPTQSATDNVETPTQASEQAPAGTTNVDFLDGAWGEEALAPIFDKTLRIHLGFDEAGLSDAEKAAAKELIAAGDRLHDLYLDQRHPQARAARHFIEAQSDQEGLKDLFRMSKGPITTTLDNNRVKFLNVEDETASKNVYPAGTTREKFDAFLEQNPERRAELLHLRSTVQATTPENVAAALKTLDSYPALEVLHPGIRERLQNADEYMAVPYSVAYAEDIFFIYDRLNAAADLIADEDPAFARFLRLRGRDFLADDYDGGDAAWITGEFTGNLNAQIGSYETYDDTLYGVKSFFSLSLLQRDKAKTAELAASIGDIQKIEDALPYSANKTVRSDIPVGVYNVVVDYGQSRGTNTATILPNEGHLSRQYGRTILIRSNILTNEAIFKTAERSFNAAVADEHQGDLTLEGGFYRTLWHEIGHYLGPDQTKDGGDIDAALQDTADLIEEMKSDLVSLFATRMLHEDGVHSDARLKGIYAAGIRRVLQKNKPRRSQAYQTMQLIQWNWFMDKGLLRFEDGRLHIDYARYPEAANSLLEAVIDLQYQGDRNATEVFITQWTAWDEDLHGVVAKNMRDTEQYRYRLVTYEALGEEAK
ncbi:MAG: hypothetical protein DHS20C05_22810 [Hyphococcus sp.]|nr:MAG: hypothetical protein DHS20C05_22810 [Marinicaulis sp.]